MRRCEARQPDDLEVPPGNHLDALKGRRTGQYSIRINDQWHVCFRWTAAGADDVAIPGCHRGVALMCPGESDRTAVWHADMQLGMPGHMRTTVRLDEGLHRFGCP